MYLEPKLNNLNNHLLDRLRKHFTIDFVARKANYCEVFFKNNSALIYYDPELVSDECISHELLHISLKLYNYEIGNPIYLICGTNEKLKLIFTKNLCNYIGNCFDPRSRQFVTGGKNKISL